MKFCACIIQVMTCTNLGGCHMQVPCMFHVTCMKNHACMSHDMYVTCIKHLRIKIAFQSAHPCIHVYTYYLGGVGSAYV